jgi:hypothetical protein
MGRCYLADGELRLRPFTLYLAKGMENLGLDGAAPAIEKQPAIAVEAGEVEEEREPEAPVDSASQHRIRTFESMLEEMAEIGRGALTERRRNDLMSASRSLEGAGLPILGRAARAIAEGPTTEIARRILRGRYLAALHRDLSTLDSRL